MLRFLVLRKIGKTELSRQQMFLNAAAARSQREIEKRSGFNQESRSRQSFEDEITTPHGSLFETVASLQLLRVRIRASRDRSHCQNEKANYSLDIPKCKNRGLFGPGSGGCPHGYLTRAGLETDFEEGLTGSR